MRGTVLLADDDRAIRTVLTRALCGEGYRVEATGNAMQLKKWVHDGRGDVVVADVMMPDGNGLELLPDMVAARPGLPVIVMSARNSLVTAVQASDRGAFDYLPKPFDIDDFLASVAKALESCADRLESDFGQHEEIADDPHGIIGRSPAMQEVFRVMARVMKTDLGILIEGASGTGKELIAHALHRMGPRAEKPFVAINMAAIPQELIESELFGHEKGSFTGADRRKIGKFEEAHGGTLFLDEIGDMPLNAQTRLLRVLQDGVFNRVGGHEAVRADTRIIAATHRNLDEMMKSGQFREDLYFRLNVVPVTLPPLSERRADIPDLVVHFSRLAVKSGLPKKHYDADALEVMAAHDWPGNVRELGNFVYRMAVLRSEDSIGREAVLSQLPVMKGNDRKNTGSSDLSSDVERHLRAYFEAHGEALPASGLYARFRDEVDRPLIRLVLEAVSGNQLKAAELLGINRNTLRKKIMELGIDIPGKRGDDAAE